MPPFWLIPASGALAGVVCAAVGIVSVVGPNRRLQATLERVQAKASAVSPAAAAETFARIARDADAVRALLARAGAALSEIRTGFADLRLPKAMAALRIARLALAALAALR